MKRKGIVIVAVCLILVGLLSVNGTLANTVNRIFQIINGDQPEQNEQMLQVKLINETFAADGSGLTEMNGMPNITPAYYPDKFDWDNDKENVIIGGQAYVLWKKTLRSPVSKVVSVQNMAVEEGAKDAYFRVAIAVDANIFHLIYSIKIFHYPQIFRIHKVHLRYNNIHLELTYSVFEENDIIVRNR